MNLKTSQKNCKVRPKIGKKKFAAGDLQRAGGKFDSFIGPPQGKYGCTSDRAEEETDRRLAIVHLLRRSNRRQPR